MVGRFLGREISKRPTCPFCGLLIDRPKEWGTQVQYEMPMGQCPCGAVFAYDVTGHNLGTAMVNALVFGCNGDWDLAWGLTAEDDYQEGRVEHYDQESHLVIPGGAYEGRGISGALFFIRLHEKVQQVEEKEVPGQGDKPLSPQPFTKKKRTDRLSSKRKMEALVRDYQVHGILEMAQEDPGIIRDIQRLLYSVDKEMRWKAADLLGQASAFIAQKDPGPITRLLQGLFTSLKDTAASSWGALDAIGEILRNEPGVFAGHCPLLYSFAQDRALLPEVLRALARISEKCPDRVTTQAHQFIPLLEDPDPDIRGYTALFLGNVGLSQAKPALERLVDDPAAIDVYHDGAIEKRTVGHIARLASEKL